MSEREQQVKQHTLNWVQSFIIKYNMCPFANAPVVKSTLRLTVSQAVKKAHALEELMTEFHFLDEHPLTETTLIVFPDSFKDFYSYLDLVALAEQLIVQLEYEGIYQVASFHPDYYFADTDPEDVTNYTNRSPYPMLHILREESLEKAINVYGDTYKIPEKNMATLRNIGLDEIKKIQLNQQKE
ncbi:MAG: DUF1415 domain-containing protein [Legionella sp.]|nr:DUF1415 domain-containing protein [Legionella sp.]